MHYSRAATIYYLVRQSPQEWYEFSRVVLSISTSSNFSWSCIQNPDLKITYEQMRYNSASPIHRYKQMTEIMSLKPIQLSSLIQINDSLCNVLHTTSGTCKLGNLKIGSASKENSIYESFLVSLKIYSQKKRLKFISKNNLNCRCLVGATKLILTWCSIHPTLLKSYQRICSIIIFSW